MKKFTFKNVLDGFRQTVQPPTIRQEHEIQETLKSDNFTVRKTFRHGFPYSPTAFAFDPVQKLLAVGDKAGNLRILGRPGVDVFVRHEGESACAVILAEFIINDGALVTVTADDTLHLWNIRQKVPTVVQSLKFQRERVTCFHLPVASKWLYVGTEKGNIHVVNIDTFALSGYVINWNKAMEVVRATHPGAVIALCDNPLDANKLLMAYESGLLVLWDLKSKFAEIRWQASEPVKSIAWHYEGRYFVSSHTDGSICSWLVARPTPKPQSMVCPHAKANKDGALEKCKAIYKVDLKASKTGETYTIFSGGMPTEKGSKSNCITVMVGKTTTVLEMEHVVVDFITLCENPWASETQEPYAIAVLLQYDLVLIDLLSTGFPCFESPYPMDLHESPVTCCTYLTDCPSDLVPALYSVGRITTAGKKSVFSDLEWPISGGEWSPASCSYSEIVITGHQDGSLKFWDSGAGSLQVLYKFKTAKFFDKPKNLHASDSIDYPFAIQLIFLCSESRRLCVAGALGQVMLFKFRKIESHSIIFVLDIPIISDYFDDICGNSPDFDFTPHQVQKSESSDSEKTADGGLSVRSGTVRIAPGFHPQIFCFTIGPNKKCAQVTSISVNSSYGLMAYGTEYGLVVIDIIQKNYLLSVACPDLYGGHDPYSRTPKSPKRLESKDEQSRSPSSDQPNDTTSPDTPSVEFLNEADESPTSRPLTPENTENRTTEPFAKIGTLAAPATSSHGGAIPKSPLREAASTSTPAPMLKDLPERRKSMSWKTFNLKRQFSKVNMKIGSSIGLNNNNENEPFNNKNSSVFYTQKEYSTDESTPVSPVPTKDMTVPKGVECRESMTESMLGEAVDELQSELDGSRNLNRESSNETPSSSSKRVEFVDNLFESDVTDDSTLSARPDNLPLASSGEVGSAAGGGPSKPPRQKSKEKRDVRLLSVPNIKYQPRDMRTGRTTTTTRNDTSPSFSGSSIITKKTHKLDGTFSRSRSSSMSSIDMSSTESVTCLAFMESLAKVKDVFSLVPTLWIGTSFGSVLSLLLNIPERDVRSSQPISLTLNGKPMLRLKGSITSMSFLDSFGTIIPYSYEPWRNDSKDTKENAEYNIQLSPTRTPTTANTTSTTTTAAAITTNPSSGSGGGGSNVSSSASNSGISGSCSTGLDTIADRQYIVVASDKQTKVFDILNQCCLNRLNLSEMDFAVKSDIISMKGGTCLATYLSKGHLTVHSLPSLKLLLDSDFLPLMDLSFQTKCKQGIVDPMLSIWGQQIIVHEDTTQISKIFCFSHKGHGLYMASPTEIQKFTISAEFCQFIHEMMGSLYTVREMPEQPKESFFKGLFGGGAKNLDREELFGEQSGRANRSIAKHIPGPTLEQLNQRTSTAASEISRAHQLAMERGEKLNLLEERAERMASQAQDFSGTAHQLMLKYKDKKWYQL